MNKKTEVLESQVMMSERLILQPFTMFDTKTFYELNTNSYIRRYMWDDMKIPITMAEDIIQKNSEQFELYGYGLWKIMIKGAKTIVGYTGLWHFFNEPQPQLLYALLKPYTGKGFVNEAARSMIDFAFSHLDFEYLIAATDEPNEASRKVAESLGMKLFKKRICDGQPTLFYQVKKEEFYSFQP